MVIRVSQGAMLGAVNSGNALQQVVGIKLLKMTKEMQQKESSSVLEMVKAIPLSPAHIGKKIDLRI